ncbi:fumarylacetoacetate hydrolase family protein [Streptomyces sp. NPDC046716]|uniref:fumarylacetoacetate hydrolase family protein n=1 Tax=Streptomyces sp. NPDC046716 TaxID=3157093 RepID=UPI0033D8709E
MRQRPPPPTAGNRGRERRRHRQDGAPRLTGRNAEGQWGSGDEIDDPKDITIRTWCTGTLAQEGSTRSRIFSVAELIAYCSRWFTPAPGDVILLGAPSRSRSPVSDGCVVPVRATLTRHFIRPIHPAAPGQSPSLGHPAFA